MMKPRFRSASPWVSFDDLRGARQAAAADAEPAAAAAPAHAPADGEKLAPAAARGDDRADAMAPR